MSEEVDVLAEYLSRGLDTNRCFSVWYSPYVRGAQRRNNDVMFETRRDGGRYVRRPLLQEEVKQSGHQFERLRALSCP